MPDEKIGRCKVRLSEDLNEVAASLTFTTSAFKTYASSGDILPWVAPQAELRMLIEDFRSTTKLTDLNFIYQSLYVQAWSAFEFFVRTLVVSYLEDLSDRANDFDSLNRAKLIERNLYHTGVALQQIFENRSNITMDFFGIAKNVGTSIPNSKSVSLNAVLFGVFLKGPSVSGIEEALKRVGYKDFDWDNVGKSKPVQKAFGTNRPRETSKQVIEFLQNAEKTRNNIVHRGENIQPVTEADVKQVIAAFQSIGDALADFLQKAIV